MAQLTVFLLYAIGGFIFLIGVAVMFSGNSNNPEALRSTLFSGGVLIGLAAITDVLLQISNKLKS